MKRNSLQEGLGRLAGALMSNKFAGSNAVWHPYLPPGVLLTEGEAPEPLFQTEETQAGPPQTGQQEIQLSAGPATACNGGGKSRESTRFPTNTVQHRAALRRAVVLSEIIGEPVCRKRKRKAYGDQGNHSRG
ncbi:hypothetical protein [Eisenbergiella sp.]|uniref:hypothetical protein n=1 Tax=Eisenbergiella sp. TaxID=1924109 RepID=UPI002082BB9A|nr:hypothetical protein [Eisenbergiella sp.]BDF49063.1 hypothetical protein CE91St56_61860 [Lachnospiraceae bacterium]GKH45142.1 hypothetical protein CE91St57_61160 [Lachnospiraceae bacterium]